MNHLAENHGLTWPQIRQYIFFMPIIVIIVTIIATLLTPVFSQIEGRFFPVAKDYKLTIHQGNDYRSVISGNFNKVRACDLIRIEWWATKDGVDTHTHSHRLGTIAYGLGQHSGSKWTVELSPRQLRNNAYAIAYHRCHPFWPTVTKFYP